MKRLGTSGASGVTKLVEGNENDPRGCSEFRLKDLDHGNALPIDLKYSTFGAGRRIVYRLRQLDDVEVSDVVRYRHRVSMLKGWISRNQPWCIAFFGVVPGELYRGISASEGDSNPGFASKPIWRSITNLSNHGVKCRFDDLVPKKHPVIELNLEDGCPFGTVSTVSKNPIFHLGPCIPGILGSRKRFTCSRWPSHSTDAMERRRACASPKSRLRAIDHAKGARA